MKNKLQHVLVSLTICFLSLSEGLAADYYWVGGTGNWTDPNHWATTSGGGTKHISAPTVLDNVIFDASSFSGPNQVVTLPVDVACQNMIWAGFTNNPTLRGAATLKLTVAGNVNIAGTMTWDFSGEVVLTSTNPTVSINFGGNTIKSTVNSKINPDATLEVTGGLISTKDLLISQGSLLVRNQTLRLASFQVYSSLMHNITLDNCQVYLNGGTVNAFFLANETTVFQADNTDLFFLSGGMTINKATGTHKLRNLEADGANTGFQILNNRITGANAALQVQTATLRSSARIQASVQYDVLILTPGKSYEFKGGSVQRFNTLNASGNCSLPIFINSLDIGMAATFNSPNNQNITFVRIKDISASGATFNATSSSNLGNTTGWSFGPGSAGTTLYWVAGNGRWSDPIHWSTSSGGPGGACIPTGADKVIFDNRSFSGAGQSVTIDVPLAECADMNWLAITLPATLTSSTNSSLEINGSLILSPNLTNNFGGTITFQSNKPETIKTFDIPFGGGLVLDGTATASWTLDDDLNCKDLKLVGGSFNTQGYDVKTIRFESNGTSTRGLNLGTTRFYTNFWNVVYMGFTAQFSNASIILQYPNAQFINSGGNQVFRRLESQDNDASILSFGGTTTYNFAIFYQGAKFTGDQDFNDVQFSAGYEYIFESNQTYNMGIFRANGTCRGMINFRSSGTTPATFKTSSAQAPNRVIVQNIVIDGPAYNATGSLKFGTTTGWNITNSTGRTLYWVGGTGLWEDINHWALTSNGRGGECLPTPVDSVIFDENSFTADGQTVKTAVGIFGQCKEFITRPGMRFAEISLEDLEVYGSVIIQPGVKFYTERLLLNGDGAKILQLSRQPIGDVFIYGYGSGSWTMQDPLICKAITNLHGHLITNSHNIDAKSLRFDNTSRGTLGSSRITLSSTGFTTAGTFHISAPAVTIDPGNYTIEITAQGGAAVVVGTHTLANLYFSNHNGKSLLVSNEGDRTRPVVTYKSVIFNNNALVRGAHSIDSLIGSSGKTYELESGVTQRVNKYLEIRGNNCNRSSLVSTVPNVSATISGPPSLKVDIAWLLLTDQIATGGANFTALSSLSIRNVTGWTVINSGATSTTGILGPDRVLCPGAPLILNQFRQIDALAYRWTNNVTSDTFLVTAPGVYSVDAFFGAGCLLPDTINILPGPSLALNLGPDTIVCGSSYSLNGHPGVDSANYLWSHNVNLNMPNIVINTSGAYRLTITSKEGCTVTDEVNVRLRTPPTVTTQPNYQYCQGDSVVVDPFIQTASILYWSDPRLFGPRIAYKQPGNYYVHVLDNVTGCRDTSFFTVTEIPIPTFSLGPDTTACDGSSISLAPDRAPSGATFRWNTGSTASALPVNQSGNYALTVTDRGCTASASRRVTIQANQTINLKDTAICAGDALMIDLSALGFSSGTAVWQPGNLNGLKQTFSQAGAYSLEYTLGSCTTRDTFILTLHPRPPIDLGINDTTLCAGSSIRLNAVTPGARSYRWQDNNTASARVITTAGTYKVTVTSTDGCTAADSVTISFLQSGGLNIPDLRLCDGVDTLIDLKLGSANILWSTGATTDTLRLSSPGTYGVTVTQGLCRDSATFTITQATSPVQNLGADTTLCAGSSVSLAANVAVPGTTWVWEDGSAGAARNINQSGTYWISATANGCTAADTISISVIDNNNTLNLHDTSICAGDSLVIDLGSPGGPVSWSHGSSASRVTFLTAGTYQVTITLATCNAVDGFTLSVNPLPVQNLGPDTSLCSGQSLNIRVNTVVPGTTWQWEDLSQSPSRFIDSSGLYILTAEANGCFFTDSIQVAVIDNSSNQITLPDTVICAGDTLRVDLGVKGLGAVWSDGQNGPQAHFHLTGTYTILVTHGLCSTADTFNLQVNPVPQQNLGPDTTLCIGQSITLTANQSLPGTTWVWEDGSSALTRFIDSTGTYSLTASLNGCTAQDTIQITVIDNRNNIIDLQDTTICDQDTLHLDLGLSGIQMLWSDGQSGALAAFTQAGKYWIDIIQGTCSTVDTFTLMVNPVPTFDLGPDITLCSTVNYSLVPGPFPANTSFLWSDGYAQADRNVNTGMRYTLEARLNGCSFKDSVVVLFVDPDNLNIASSYDYCAGSPFSLNIAGSNLSWSNGQTGPVFTTASPGQFTVTSFNGYCSTQDTFTVVEVPVPIFNLGPDTLVCEGARLSWDFRALNAQSYVWQDNSTSPVFSTTFLSQETIKLEAINFTAARLRCLYSDSIVIRVIPNPIFSLGSDITLCPAEDVLLTLPPGLPGVVTWNNGTSASSLLVSSEGEYSAQVDNQGCIHKDTIYVAYQKVDPVSLGTDTILCQGTRLELNAEVPGGKYAWNTGATTSRLLVSETGQYIVNVLNGACVTSDSIVVTFDNCNLADLYIPNVFSPNGDGFNDDFAAFAPPDIQVLEFQMVIADRWGNLVFTSTGMDQTWDGRAQNRDLFPGVYVYTAKIRYRKLNIEKSAVLQGDVTIVR